MIRTISYEKAYKYNSSYWVSLRFFKSDQSQPICRSTFWSRLFHSSVIKYRHIKYIIIFDAIHQACYYAIPNIFLWFLFPLVYISRIIKTITQYLKHKDFAFYNVLRTNLFRKFELFEFLLFLDKLHLSNGCISSDMGPPKRTDEEYAVIKKHNDGEVKAAWVDNYFYDIDYNPTKDTETVSFINFLYTKP